MRFKFGANWKAYSKNALDLTKLEKSKSHLFFLVSKNQLTGKSFLDIGFGQGLALCIAIEAGARAIGIEVDPDNVAALRATLRFFPGLEEPPFEIGSILDKDLVQRYYEKGGFDIVYSWGVLHHTGDMWTGIDHASQLVKQDGILIISLYKKHWTSPIWKQIKKTYNFVPGFIKKLMIWFFVPVIFVSKFVVTRENPLIKERGMSFYFDVVDWVGGYPYEYTDQSDVIRFLSERGFVLYLVRPDKVPTGVIEYGFKKNGMLGSAGSALTRAK